MQFNILDETESGFAVTFSNASIQLYKYTNGSSTRVRGANWD